MEKNFVIEPLESIIAPFSLGGFLKKAVNFVVGIIKAEVVNIVKTAVTKYVKAAIAAAL